MESIPFLKEQLGIAQDDGRAFWVSQLTRLGHVWTDLELEALRQDTNWKVRLNLLLAMDGSGLRKASADENDLVKIVAALLADRRAAAEGPVP